MPFTTLQKVATTFLDPVQKRVAETVNAIIDRLSRTPEHFRTAAEISAGVTPVDYRYRGASGIEFARYGGATGATGTVNQSAFNNARDVATVNGGKVILPEGTFAFEQIFGKSNVHVIGQGKGKTILDFTNASAGSGAFSDSAIYCDGTLGDAVAATTDLAIGSTSVATDSAHGVVADDWILLVGDTDTSSLNDALDTDAGDNQLGDDTQVVPFAEIIQVDSVSGTTINFRGANVFPYTDKLFVHKLTPVENFVLEGVTVRFGTNLTRNRFRRAMGLKVTNCSFESAESDGKMRSISPEMCWDSEIVGNTIEFDASSNTSASLATDYQGISLFNGCTRVRVAKNVVKNPTQGIDVTYNDSVTTQAAPCREIDIEENTVVGASYHGITTHPGSESVRIKKNTLTQCETGIYNRCRRASITENSIHVTGEGSTSYGVWLGDQGYYLFTDVSRNKIIGADVGVQLGGASGPFKNRDVKIADNEFHSCGVGINADSTGATTEMSNLYIGRNRFFNSGTQHIEIATINNGVVLEGNIGYGAVSSRGMRIGACDAPVMRNNIVYDCGSGIVPFSLANACTNWVYDGNLAFGTNGAEAPPNEENSKPSGINNTKFWSVQLDDDEAKSVSIQSNHCMALVSCFVAAGNGIAHLRTATGTVLAGDTNFAATTGVLEGTTGTDGDVTVSMDTGTLYIENRSGSADTFGLVIVGSSS